MAPGILEDRPSLNEQYMAAETRDAVFGLPSFPKHPASKMQTTAQSMPDIDWVPSFEKYMKRAEMHLKQGGLPRTLPPGFPASVDYEACWTKDSLSPSSFIHVLSPDDISEIESALNHFKGLGLPMDDISQETFPLPSLAQRLREAAREVLQGCGVVVLRGMDPTKYNLRDNVILYAGVTAYIGEKRGIQDASGNVLVHVKDVGAGVAPDHQRQSPYANNAQPFHNDLGDIIAMYAMDRAGSGGKSKLASTAYVYNELARSRPDLIHVLSKDDWPFDKHTDDPSYYSRPILFHDNQQGRVFCCFSRRQLTGSSTSPRPESLPVLSEMQAEALDAVHFAAAEGAIEVQLERGDMQFLNNLAVFHAREAFTDGPDNHRRHLIRMWVRNEKLAWPTPEGLEEVWEEIYGSKRVPQWYLQANHSQAHVINRRHSCHG